METYMKNQGYKFYVYVRPGVIEYFFDREPAQDFADKHSTEVQELD